MASSWYAATSTGGLTNIAYGIYRFDDIAYSDHDQLMEAVLQVGPEAHLTRDTVLAMHDLALVNPKKLRVGTPRRVRATLPPYIEVVHENLPSADLTRYEGIPSATVARALLDCVGTVMADRMLQAVDQARNEGLLRENEAHQLRAKIGPPR